MPVFGSAQPIHEATETATSDKPSIAVLPFINTSNDPDQTYFADGLTEDLTADLSAVSQLFVIARSSVASYAGKDPTPQSVGRDLGVRYILDGSVRKSGSSIRITAALVETETARQIWSKQYDREVTDIFAVQDEVIGEIVSALSVQLTEVEQRHIARIPTGNLEAYDNYLRAETEGYYRANFQTRALEYYSKAIHLDPNFADAHAGYARVAAEVFRLGSDQVMPASMAQKLAYKEAGRALELDPNNARAYMVLAILQMNDARHDEALRSARLAIALSPSDAEAQVHLGMVLSYNGNHEEAVAATEQAMRLNPMAPPGFRLLSGIVFFNARQYDRAVNDLEPVVRTWPDAEIPAEYLAATYALRGDTERARREAKALTDLPQTNLAWFRLFFADSYKRPEDLEHFLQGLKLAGVPQWPLGFEGRAQDRITGIELASLAIDRTWRGTSPVGKDKSVPFILQIDKQGRVAYRGAITFLTGEARIVGDQICMRFQSYLRNRWVCGDVFRNISGGRVETYVYVLPDGLRYFLTKT